MKSANIIFKVLGYAIIIGGLASLVFILANPTAFIPEDYSTYQSDASNTTYQQEASSVYKHHEEPSEIKGINSTTETHYSPLIGKWKATYKDIGGAVVYDIKKERNKFKAYIYEIQDENGYGEKVSTLIILTIKSFDGNNGKGIYKLSYNGEKYDVPCKFKLLDKNTFQLSYDYYGHTDTEVWKRQ